MIKNTFLFIKKKKISVFSNGEWHFQIHPLGREFLKSSVFIGQKFATWIEGQNVENR